MWNIIFKNEMQCNGSLSHFLIMESLSIIMKEGYFETQGQSCLLTLTTYTKCTDLITFVSRINMIICFDYIYPDFSSLWASIWCMMSAMSSPSPGLTPRRPVVTFCLAGSHCLMSCVCSEYSVGQVGGIQITWSPHFLLGPHQSHSFTSPILHWFLAKYFLI